MYLQRYRPIWSYLIGGDENFKLDEKASVCPSAECPVDLSAWTVVEALQWIIWFGGCVGKFWAKYFQEKWLSGELWGLEKL